MTIPKRVVWALIASIALSWAWASAAQAERRLAFVVGIDAYPNLGADAQLQRAVSDAEAVGNTLSGLGFVVTRLTRAPVTQEVLLRRFGEFTRTVEAGDLVLFYFSGHGIGLDGANYLLPSDVPSLQAGDERLIKARALAETDVSGDLRSKGARVAVLVLDSCRNDPFSDPGHRSLALGRGLARVEPATGVLTIYAASAGHQALDRLSDTNDPDPNSVFTRVFIKTLKEPGLNVSELGDRVRDDVATLARSAGQDQVPAVSNEVVGAREIFLAGRPSPAPSAAPASATAGRSEQCGRLFDAARSIDTAAAYQAYIDQCQGDAFLAMAIAAQARLSPPAATPVAAATRAAAGVASLGTDDSPDPLQANDSSSGPSFNCTQARSSVEHAICDTPRLGSADRRLDGMFKQVASGMTVGAIVDITKAQGVWLRQRNACQQQAVREIMVACIERSYGERIAQLRQMLPTQVAPGRPTPSFDCAAARSTIERLICADTQLADRDRELSAVFARRLESLSLVRQRSLTKEQMGWWATRESCTRGESADLKTCVLNAYEARIQDLGGPL